MREIKFRGLTTKSNAEWVCGYVIKKGSSAYIQTEDALIYVCASTVGQYTGLKDKNGKEIYEGDIIKLADGNVGKVGFKNGAFYHTATSPIIGMIFWNEVIGNIYEKPELLEGGEK